MNKKELEVVKQGILNEIEGYEFYKMAAKGANSEDSKEAFLLLAEEELKHLQYLKELVEKHEKKDLSVKLSFLENPPSPQIFKWKEHQFKDPSLEVAVFGIAVSMEKASMEFYEKAKNETTDAEAKKLYEILIGWEKVHFDQFMGAYEQSRTQWFSQQGFAPF